MSSFFLKHVLKYLIQNLISQYDKSLLVNYLYVQIGHYAGFNLLIGAVIGLNINIVNHINV